MTKSMTGFGMVSQAFDNYSITVEVKSLNSKFADVSLRLPPQLSVKEIELKKKITDTLIRGKISVTVEITAEAQSENLISKEDFQNYFDSYKALASSMHVSEESLFNLAVHAPGVVAPSNNLQLPEEVVETVPEVIIKAVEACDTFRIQEGVELENKLKDYISSILENLKSIEQLDAGRTTKVADRLRSALENLQLEVDIDKNRFEQELIYYIEKFDINEERVRLETHLNYFMEVLNSEISAGKKLGFVSQEIGREINTIGSKANDASIQKHVVAMKEELEKIKEQSLNIL